MSTDQTPPGYTLIRTKTLTRARWTALAISLLLASSQLIIAVWANPLLQDMISYYGMGEKLPWDTNIFLNLPKLPHAIASVCVIVALVLKEHFIKRAEVAYVISAVLSALFGAGLFWYLIAIIRVSLPGYWEGTLM